MSESKPKPRIDLDEIGEALSRLLYEFNPNTTPTYRLVRDIQDYCMGSDSFKYPVASIGIRLVKDVRIEEVNGRKYVVLTAGYGSNVIDTEDGAGFDAVSIWRKPKRTLGSYVYVIMAYREDTGLYVFVVDLYYFDGMYAVIYPVYCKS